MTDAPDDKMLCYCKNVRYGEVRAAIAKLDAKNADQVRAECEAGGGCRTCVPEVDELIQEYRAKTGGSIIERIKKILFKG